MVGALKVSDVFDLLSTSLADARRELGANDLLVPLEPWDFGQDRTELVTSTAKSKSRLVKTTSGQQALVAGARFYPLVPGPPVLLGRSSSLALVVDQPTVSRLHAEIFNTAGNFYVRDRDSYNGTLVNDRLLGPNDAVALRKGDVLALGEARLLFAPLPHLAALLGLKT